MALQPGFTYLLTNDVTLFEWVSHWQSTSAHSTFPVCWGTIAGLSPCPHTQLASRSANTVAAWGCCDWSGCAPCELDWWSHSLWLSRCHSSSASLRATCCNGTRLELHSAHPTYHLNHRASRNYWTKYITFLQLLGDEIVHYSVIFNTLVQPCCVWWYTLKHVATFQAITESY